MDSFPEKDSVAPRRAVGPRPFRAVGVLSDSVCVCVCVVLVFIAGLSHGQMDRSESESEGPCRCVHKKDLASPLCRWPA